MHFKIGRGGDGLSALAGRHRMTRLLWTIAIILLLAVAFAAGRSLAKAPADNGSLVLPTTYTVAQGTVEQVQSFSAVASWEMRPVATSAAAGVVTSVSLAAGATVSSGSVVASVNLRPMVVAEGPVPSFRTLQRDDSGQDVRQLQMFLSQIGKQVPTDGTMDFDTVAAVKSWQTDLGLEATGVVVPGDIVFVPDLPARLTLSGGVRVGSMVAAGDLLLSVVSDSPTVTVSLAAEQSSLVPQSGMVRVATQGYVWSGVIASSEAVMDGGLLLSLTAADGGAICGPDCAEALPVDATTNLATELVVVPTTRGPVVPAAALLTTPDNGVVVKTPQGNSIKVAIIASANGLSVVSGIEAGTIILLNPQLR